MVIHSKVLGRDFSCEAKDAKATMKAVLALEAEAETATPIVSKETEKKYDSALETRIMELDAEFDKVQEEFDTLESRAFELQKEMDKKVARLDEIENEINDICDLLYGDEDEDCDCDYSCDCDDCPDREACCDDCLPSAVIIIDDGDERDFDHVPHSVVEAILELLED